MVASPPRVTGTRDQQAWFAWAEGKIRSNAIDIDAAKVRIVAGEATSTSLAQQTVTIIGDTEANAKSAAQGAPTSRIPAPLTDDSFWSRVISGKHRILGGAMKANVYGVTASSAGLTFVAREGQDATIDVTPVVEVPASRKVYVSGVADGAFKFRIFWMDVPGNVFTETTLVKGNALAPPLANHYSVAIEVAAPSSGPVPAVTVSAATVFEVIGTSGPGGFEIGPDGMIVYGDDGSDVHSVRPNLPPPAAPTKPTLKTQLGIVAVHWNGLLSTGAPRSNFYSVHAERATSASGPWARFGQPLTGAGDITIPEAVGTTVHYRLVAMDNVNRFGAPSQSASVTVLGVDVGDISADLQNQIDDALDTANLAMTSVGGMATWSNVAPTTAAGAGKPVGAIWWHHVSGEVKGIYEWSGTAWSSRKVGDDMILGLNAGKINVGILDAARIAAGAIVADKLASNSVTAAKIAANAVVAEKIAASAITADKIKAGAIEVDHLSNGVGENIDITANGAVTILIDNQGGLANGVSAAQTAADEAQAAADAAATANGITDGKAIAAQKRADAAKKIADEAKAKADNTATYYRFESTGAIIGKKDSPTQLHLKNTGAEIQQNGVRVTWWDSTQMHVSAMVVQKVVLGNHQLEKSGNRTVVRWIGS